MTHFPSSCGTNTCTVINVEVGIVYNRSAILCLLPTENKESFLSKSVKEDKEGDGLELLQHCKSTSLVANSTEQGSTLRDLLTTTAGKLKLGSTDAGIAFAPVYSSASQVRTVTHLLPCTKFKLICQFDVRICFPPHYSLERVEGPCRISLMTS